MAAELGPNDDVDTLVRQLETERRDLLVVGHLPYLSRLVSELVGRDQTRPLVSFSNAGVVCLERKDAEWLVVYVLRSEHLEQRET